MREREYRMLSRRKRPAMEMMMSGSSSHHQLSSHNNNNTTITDPMMTKRKRFRYEENQRFRDRNDENNTMLLSSSSSSSRKRRFVEDEDSVQTQSKKMGVYEHNHNRQKRSLQEETFTSRKRCRIASKEEVQETRLYSQMEVNNIKQEHYAEIIRLRNELRVVSERKAGSAEYERVRQENEILKRGLNIQQQKLVNAETENLNLKRTIQMLMLQNKRLDEENSMLRAEIGSSCSNSNDFFRRMPPGVH